MTSRIFITLILEYYRKKLSSKLKLSITKIALRLIAIFEKFWQIRKEAFFGSEANNFQRGFSSTWAMLPFTLLWKESLTEFNLFQDKKLKLLHSPHNNRFKLTLGGLKWSKINTKFTLVICCIVMLNIFDEFLHSLWVVLEFFEV